MVALVLVTSESSQLSAVLNRLNNTCEGLPYTCVAGETDRTATPQLLRARSILVCYAENAVNICTSVTTECWISRNSPLGVVTVLRMPGGPAEVGVGH